MGRRVFRNYYKGHMDKTKGEGRSRGGCKQGREGGLTGVGVGSGGEKRHTTVIE